MEKDLEDKYRNLLKELSFLICLKQLKERNFLLFAVSIWGSDKVTDEVMRARDRANGLISEIVSETKREVFLERSETEFNWDKIENYLNRDI